MRNYMFERMEEAQAAADLEREIQREIEARLPAYRRKKRRRTILVFAAFLIILAALLTALLLLWDRSVRDVLDENGYGDYYEEVDPRFGVGPEFYWEFSTEEQKEVTFIPRAAVGDGTQLQIQQERGQELPPQEIYRRVLPSVVSIVVEKENGYGSGSGVVMSADGYVLTNYHVIQGGEKARVDLLDVGATQSGVYSYEAKLVGYYADLDIAVLKVEAEDLLPAQFGPSRDLVVGEPAYALGNPMGYLYGTFTDGIISAVGRTMEVGGYEMSVLQTTAALNSGNSGGALINSSGQVVGITVAKIASSSAASAEGLGLVIPIGEVRGLVNSIIKNGDPVLPFIGIMCYAREFNGQIGIYVDSVEPQAPARQAGLHHGDLILTANGRPVHTLGELKDVLFDNGLDQPLTVTVLRGSEVLEISFDLFEREE